MHTAGKNFQLQCLSAFHYIDCSLLYYLPLCGSSYIHANMKINELQSFRSLKNKITHNQKKKDNHQKNSSQEKDHNQKNNPQMNFKTQPEGSGSPVKLESPSATPRIWPSKTKRRMVFWGWNRKKPQRTLRLTSSYSWTRILDKLLQIN